MSYTSTSGTGQTTRMQYAGSAGVCDTSLGGMFQDGYRSQEACCQVTSDSVLRYMSESSGVKGYETHASRRLPQGYVGICEAYNGPVYRPGQTVLQGPAWLATVLDDQEKRRYEEALREARQNPHTYMRTTHKHTIPGASTTFQEIVSFSPDLFTNPRSPHPAFVGCTQDVIAMIQETYYQMTGTYLPNDIVIVIGDSQQLARYYDGEYHHSIAGFAYNRVGRGVSEIFVHQDMLDRVMLTIGHELGHVQSAPLKNLIDEEAKAYAFGLAWIDTIKKFNIGGLSPCVQLTPAKNGIHNVALDFVVRKTCDAPAQCVFEQLRAGVLSAM